MMEKNISKSLARHALVTGVLDGGITMPYIKMEKNDHHYQFNIRLSGVEAEDLSVEIDRQNLFVFHKMSFTEELMVPYLVNKIAIPSEVEIEEINAIYENGVLKVRLPFNDMSDGYHRDIAIIKR